MNDKIASLQKALNDLGATPPLVVDGAWGPKSQAALTQVSSSLSEPLVEDDGWGFIRDNMQIIGNDIVVINQVASWFGGSNDPEDDGSTASGVSTKLNPYYIGCSLPMNFGGVVPNTLGSPIPKIPWNTPVRIETVNGIAIVANLIDVGPAKWAKHGIDLTQKAFTVLGGSISGGLMAGIKYTIIGGAKYVRANSNNA